MNYQLELKQIVDFPRCRIYREFIQTLMKDRSIRLSLIHIFLFSHFMFLCKLQFLLSEHRTPYLQSCSWRMDLFS